MQKNNLRFRSFRTGHTFPSKYLLAAALFMVSALSFLSLMTGRYPLSFGLLLSGDTQAVQLIFGGSGIVPAALVAILLNILLPKDKEN